MISWQAEMQAVADAIEAALPAEYDVRVGYEPVEQLSVDALPSARVFGPTYSASALDAWRQRSATRTYSLLVVRRAVHRTELLSEVETIRSAVEADALSGSADDVIVSEAAVDDVREDGRIVAALVVELASTESP